MPQCGSPMRQIRHQSLAIPGRVLGFHSQAASQKRHRQRAMSFFWGGSRSTANWVSVGPVSSFPDLGSDEGNLIQKRLCDAHLQPGCKVFRVPQEDSSQAAEVHLEPGSTEISGFGDELKDQVVVFQFRGRFHAVDHVSSASWAGIDSSLLVTRIRRQLTGFARNARTPRTLYPTERHLILRISESSSVLG